MLTSVILNDCKQTSVMMTDTKLNRLEEMMIMFLSVVKTDSECFIIASYIT